MRRIAGLCLAAFGCASASPSRPAALASAVPTRLGPEELFPEFERIFGEQFVARRLPGLAMGFVLDGKLVWSKGWGSADLARKVPADADTVFRIASMTKSFTALAILRLRDEGKLALDDPATKYVPELGALRYPTHDSPPITIRMLLTHGAGFPEDNPWGDLQLALSRDDFSQLLSRGLAFSLAPDSAYEYSNTGFALLGRIVENLTGDSNEEYLTRDVLRPLGMTATVWRQADVPPAHLARGYGRKRPSAPGPVVGDGLREEPQLGDGAYAAMGGLYSSVRDLARYAAFQLAAWPPRDDPEEGPLSRSSRREMQRGWRHTGLTVRRAAGGDLNARAVSYGYGLGASEWCEDTGLVVTHGGGLPGFGSYIAMFPEHGFAFVGAANLTYSAPDIYEAAQRALAALPARPVRPVPELSRAHEAVGKLLERWDAQLAQASFDRTAFFYETPDELRAHFDELSRKLGACRRQGSIEPENALRGTSHLACEKGKLDVFITLTPEANALIQHLELTPGLPPSRALASAADRIAALIARWDGGTANDVLAGFSLARTRRSFAKEAGTGPCKVSAQINGDGASHGLFELACAKTPLDLDVTLDEQGKADASLRAHHPQDESCPRWW